MRDVVRPLAPRYGEGKHVRVQRGGGPLAEAGDGRLVGLARFRPFARPLSASVGGRLDDLFVEPADRGSGVAHLLLDALRGIGAERARSTYDQVATRTMWITYDMAPGA
ncbi:GNAT family N-acetyltransferase [Streptomyces globisporus]|uniref:GNAT family N-acetyltransferase n=1 Tax=Streptomyces globisporus TaxID=1908 RepID=UPI0006896FCD|nr:GNAT family N-acetyltransferase [Streptomyces globisporus]